MEEGARVRQEVGPDLEDLIAQRTGGAVNVRGIRFQVLYTLACALQAHRGEGAWKVTPEGLEDVDVLVDGVTEHIQVKTSDRRWAPHRLKKALSSVVEAARTCQGDPTHTFTVLLAGQVNSRVEEIAGRHRCSLDERAALDEQLGKLLRKAGAESPLADRLASTLKIRTSGEEVLAKELQESLVAGFDVHAKSANVVIGALTSFVLDQARLREPFGEAQLTQTVASVADSQAVFSSFRARGQQLISPIDWSPTEASDDFVEGRGTRPGHIAADLDVSRPRWTDRISTLLSTSRLCIIRASSGQGKSALALRYAYDQWNHEATFVLRACASPKEAAQVAEYLRARADLGVPTCLLIDGADWQLQHWPEVAATARSRGIPTLVTVRVEDWQRFAIGSAADLSRASLTNFTAGQNSADSREERDDTSAAGPLADADPIEPKLDLDEARKLFRRLRERNRVHASVRSAEEAFEKVGEPPLLMEYLYLVTHGELLRHRLSGQLRELRRNRDDDHLAVLRLATLAHACGVPVPAGALTSDLGADPQRVISEIDGEYVRLNDSDLTELHRVRSEHLAALLHKGVPSPTKSALTLLPLLSVERLRSFIGGILRYPGTDSSAIEEALVELVASRGTAVTSAISDGLFEAGERDYRDAVWSVFERSFEFIGSSGPFFLSTLLAPTKDPSIFEGLIEVADRLPDSEAGKRFRTLRDIAEEAPDAPRGYDAVRRVLGELVPRLTQETLLADLGSAGRLLQEADRVCVPVPDAGEVLHRVQVPAPLEIPDFASLVLGLFAHAPEKTRSWLNRHAGPIGEAAAEHLDLHSPPRITDGPDGPAVEIIFYPSDEDDAPSVNDQAVSRLRLLRQLYPFASHFRSRAHWFLPGDLSPTHDDSRKDMIPRYLKPPLFRKRQGLWNVLAKEPFAPSTFWAYQQSWYELRSLALDYAEIIEKAVRDLIEGRSPEIRRNFEQFQTALREDARPPLHSSPGLSERLRNGTRDWRSLLQNITQQLSQFAKAENGDKVGRLLRHNAHELVEKTREMHEAFDVLFEQVPDYFNLQSLRDREIQSYSHLATALEFWTAPPVNTPVRSLRKTLQKTRDRRDEALQRRVEEALREADVAIASSPSILRSGLSQTAVLALALPHPCMSEPAAIEPTLRALARLHKATSSDSTDVQSPDSIWVVFCVGEARFQRSGFLFYSHQLRRLADGEELNWEAFTTQPVPEEVDTSLASLPVRLSPVYEAWKVACSALLLGNHAEERLATIPSEHSRLHERTRHLCQEISDALLADAARVEVLLSNTPIDGASDRLRTVASSIRRGEFPASKAADLVERLQEYSSTLGKDALSEAKPAES